MVDAITAFDDEAGTIAVRSTVPEESPVFQGISRACPCCPVFC